MAPHRYAAKFDPFLSLDCAPVPSTLAQPKERKGSKFAIWQPCLEVVGEGDEGDEDDEGDERALPLEHALHELAEGHELHDDGLYPHHVVQEDLEKEAIDLPSSPLVRSKFCPMKIDHKSGLTLYYGYG